MKVKKTKEDFISKLSEKYFIAWLYLSMPIPQGETLASMGCHFMWKAVIGLYLTLNGLMQLTVFILGTAYIWNYPGLEPSYIEPFDELVRYEGELVRVTDPARGGTEKIHIRQGDEIKKLVVATPKDYLPYLNQHVIAYGITRSYLRGDFLTVHFVAEDGSLVKSYDEYATRRDHPVIMAIYHGYKYMAFYVLVMPWIIYLVMKKLRNTKQY